MVATVSTARWCWCVLSFLSWCRGHVLRHQVAPWNGFDFHTYPHPEKKPGLPSDIMVDVINNLGLKLLAIHNEENDNNIAISPYGALNVLIALGEGLQGEAVREIQQSARIPNDISVIRVGLRDVHRHLKSYFLPREGFLAGLTLNHENVTLRPEYEDVLRFYGFDILTFNNGLYPPPETTNTPVTLTTAPSTSLTTTLDDITLQPTTTEGMARTMEMSTVTTETSTMTFQTTTDIPATSTVTAIDNLTQTLPSKTMIVPESTTLKITTIPSTVGTTGQSSLTTLIPMTTTLEAIAVTTETLASTVTIPSTVGTFIPMTTTPETIAVTTETLASTITTPMITTANPTTVPAENLGTTIVTLVPSYPTTTTLITTTTATTESSITSTPVIPVTVTDIPPTTGITSTVVSTSTTQISIPETISTVPSIDTTERTVDTTSTRSTTITDQSPLLTTHLETTLNPITEMTTNEIAETTTVLITTKEMPTSTTDIEEQTQPNEAASLITDISTNVPMTTQGMDMITTEMTTTSKEVLETTTINVETSTEVYSKEDSTTASEIVTETSTSVPYPNNIPASIESTTTSEVGSKEIDNNANEIIPENTDNSKSAVKRNARSQNRQKDMIELNLFHKNDHKHHRRKTRSLVDYIIARYYDDHYPSYHQDGVYVPREQLSFLVYGKFKEYQINFMKYDTVLPFLYVPHLNALALRFPLDSTHYYLLLLLPVDKAGVDKLVCDLRLNESLKYIIDNLRYRHVIATIPSFRLKGYLNLTPTLQKLGIRRVFEPRQADFTPMTSVRDVYVTNIEQAITVNIRNYIDSKMESHRNLHQYEPVEFKADHPFLFFVLDTELHVTLMSGKVTNPLSSRITIAKLLGEETPPDDLGDPLDFESGPFLDCAISWIHTFKKLIIPKDMRTGQTLRYRCPSRCETKPNCKT